MPRATLVREAARLLGEHPDATSHPATTGEEEILSGLSPQLDALIRRVDGF